jgi:hypothetical protein
MSEPNSNRSSLSGFAATGKDLVAMLRDAVLLLVAVLLVVLLLARPESINSILKRAGFHKANIAGLEWEANLTQVDGTLLETQATISDLKDQNAKLIKALNELKPATGDPEAQANIASLEQRNTQLVADAAQVQTSVASSISANAALLQGIQAATGAVVNWGVVYGGDRDIEAAKYETGPVAKKYGLTNTAIYHRQGSYRSVATTSDRVQATELLQKAKGRRNDAYLVNMSSWCPNPIPRDGYSECVAP